MNTRARSLLIAALAFPIFAPHGGANEEPQKEPTPHQRVYYFEHRLLPKWTEQSAGAFLDDLQAGKNDLLLKAATDIAGAEFAQAIKVHVLTEPSGAVISFPKPKQPPECFFAAIVRDGDHGRYFALEADEDLMNNGTKAFLCEWSGESHLNLGPRSYDDEAHFIDDVRQIMGKKGGQPPKDAPAAATTPVAPTAPPAAPQPAAPARP